MQRAALLALIASTFLTLFSIGPNPTAMGGDDGTSTPSCQDLAITVVNESVNLLPLENTLTTMRSTAEGAADAMWAAADDFDAALDLYLADPPQITLQDLEATYLVYADATEAFEYALTDAQIYTDALRQAEAARTEAVNAHAESCP